MARIRKYIDSDVYTEAKKRIHHIVDTFDNVLVCFSGGKDSLVALSLLEEVYKEKGIKEKIKVVFRDEELIPDDVIDFVKEKAESGKYDFRYYAIPLKSEKYILGNCMTYVQWDRDRKHLRKAPDYAITLADEDYKVFDQYSADAYICKNLKGRVAMITGIRADESLFRLRACLNRMNECYINATEDTRIKLCKPIYDWTEDDVFLYFFKTGIRYCSIYDVQMLNNENLRVSTPLHAESAKQFDKIKTRYPVFYQQLVELFPEMLLQERYYKDYGKNEKFDQYPHTFDGVRKYCYDNISDDKKRKQALVCINSAENMRKNNVARGNRPFGGYPIRYVFQQVVNGTYKRGVFQPKGKSKLGKLDYEFEGLVYGKEY